MNRLVGLLRTFEGHPSAVSVGRRATHLLTQPAAEWKAIAGETGGMRQALWPYTGWTILLPALVGSFVQLVFDLAISAWLFLATGERPEVSLAMTLVSPFLVYAGTLLSVLIVARVLAAVVSHEAPAAWVRWTRLLVYAGTPYFLSEAVLCVPLMGLLLSIGAGFYSLILAFEGYRVLFPPAERAAAVSGEALKPAPAAAETAGA